LVVHLKTINKGVIYYRAVLLLLELGIIQLFRIWHSAKMSKLCGYYGQTVHSLNFLNLL